MTSKKRLLTIFAMLMLLPVLAAADPRDPLEVPILADGDAAWDDRFDVLGVNTTVWDVAVDVCRCELCRIVVFEVSCRVGETSV